MSKKTIVLIAPTVFGFYQHIKIALEKLDINVCVIDELPYSRYPLIRKLFLKLPKQLKSHIFRAYILNLKSTCCDTLFLIRGELFTFDILNDLEFKFAPKNRVMYQWDFEKNLPLLKQQIPYFNRVFTFDKDDSNKLNLTHKPLFFNPLHQAYAKNNIKEKYLVSFVGTHHSDRYEFSQLFLKLNPKLAKQSLIYLLRSKMSFFLNKYIKQNKLGGISFSEIKSRPLTEIETLEVLSASRAILDIHQPGQQGLTIRTFEALGLQKKLITTNPQVKKYDFYNPNNILVVDRGNPVVPDSFMNTPYEPTPIKIYNKYLVTHWVKDFI
ncbi:hypothetical protein PNIG_a0501 [Pseudoalteromonas nigrifaciens]|uniref:Uncharacterized protein n=1 Tax=Pseudoalteromonas nigrifaciens TaxID=28109 RepID=A0AAC9UHC7_9GAMM|nr:hypothetical protein [Pseudoalteromonas nigrifaciens]ASM52811.1 hypothetical protein PNIG_a0501 [Pseudoalteromonas nigrifaciens]GEN43175.1 hypothetical protein PNI02_26410 [Pseudoalteromonas nigrifaciens]SUC53312.1 Uncharacterized protein conserved in bacteria [Pseudoalteromonas nigrifaciens]